MKYNKTASIIGYGGKVTGRMPRDRVKRVTVTRRAIHVETRKGRHGILAFCNMLAGLVFIR